MALANTNKAMVPETCVYLCIAISTHYIVYMRKSIRFLFTVCWFAHIANIGFIVDI